MSIVRVTLAVFCLVSAVTFSPWVPLLGMGAHALLFRSWEIILIGFVVDMLWIPGGVFADTWALFTIAGILLAWGFEPLRNELFPFSN